MVKMRVFCLKLTISSRNIKNMNQQIAKTQTNAESLSKNKLNYFLFVLCNFWAKKII